MKKALQGFWRGGLLGSWLGFLGGTALAVFFFFSDLISLIIEVGSLKICAAFDIHCLMDFLDLVGFLFLFLSVPGLVFGFLIGATMGIPLILKFSRLKTWKRVIASVGLATFLFILIVGFVYWNRHLFTFGHLDLYLGFKMYAIFIWPIYIIIAILYGYHFPTFTPRWPKFLRRKQFHTE